MAEQINLPAIIIADAMGFFIILSFAVGSFWQVRAMFRDNKVMIALLLISMVSCIVDPLCSAADGHPGVLNYICVYLGNTWLYLGNVITNLCWLMFMTLHIGYKLPKLHQYLLGFVTFAAVILLIINIFEPVVFAVDANNAYHRKDGYWFFVISQVGILFDGFVLYLYCQRKSDGMKFFPAWAFFLPTLFGAGLQIVYYGISTTTPFIVVSIGCVMGCLQNEMLFRDKLTGLYNRFYLNTLEGKLNSQVARRCGAIMLDLNSFKMINDMYGHTTGDKALIDTSKLLLAAVGADGVVMRYAGDEFIIVLNTDDESKTLDVMRTIEEAMAAFNETSGNPYKLSVSMGHYVMDPRETTIDGFMDEIDRLMYENKRNYYRSHADAVKNDLRIR